MLTLRNICVIKDNELVVSSAGVQIRGINCTAGKILLIKTAATTDRWIALRANPRLVKISIADQSVDNSNLLLHQPI